MIHSNGIPSYLSPWEEPLDASIASLPPSSREQACGDTPGTRRPIPGTWATTGGLSPTGCLTASRAISLGCVPCPRQPGQYGLIHHDVYADNFFYAPAEVQLFDFDQSCYGCFLQDLVNPIYLHCTFPGVSIPGATMADLAVFFRHLVTGYRTEQPLSLDQLRLANAHLQLKEGFVYLILNAQLAQWATTLHLPLETLRMAIAAMEHRILTDAPVVDLDFTMF